MNTQSNLICASALAVLLVACGGIVPVPSPSPKPEAVSATPANPAPTQKAEVSTVLPFDLAARKQQAIRLAEETDYRSALIQWKILQTLQPDEPEYSKRIRDLEDLINREIQARTNEGKQAAAQDNPAGAKHAWLSVLALDPHNQTALQVLRAIEEQRVKSIQATNTAHVRRIATSKNGDRPAEERNQADYYLEMGIHLFEERDWQGSQREIEKYLGAYPDDPKARTVLARVHQSMALELEKEGQLTAAAEHLDKAKALDKKVGKAEAGRAQKIKKELAEQFYQEALRLPRDNLDDAIVLLRKAVSFDPNHNKAKGRLDKTLQMQKKLKAISNATEKPR